MGIESDCLGKILTYTLCVFIVAPFKLIQFMERSDLAIRLNKLPPPEDVGRDSMERIREVHDLISRDAKAARIGIVKSDVLEVKGRGLLKPSFFEEKENLEGAIDGLSFPKSLKYGEFCSKSFFPVVVKNPNESHGRCKYLVEDSETFAKFQAWVVDNSLGSNIEENWVFQEYIESPGDRPTSFRVLVDCRGEVLASQLLYGPERDNDRRVTLADRYPNQRNIPEAALEDPGAHTF